MTEPGDRRADRSRALASSTIVVAFYLVSQLVVVPLIDQRPSTAQAAPALVVALLMFGITYCASIAIAGRWRRRHRD